MTRGVTSISSHIQLLRTPDCLCIACAAVVMGQTHILHSIGDIQEVGNELKGVVVKKLLVLFVG